MTTTHASAAESATARRPFGLGRLAIIAVAAAAANALVFVIGSAAGASMGIDSPAYSEITVVMSVFATLVPLLIAGAVTWLIARPWPTFHPIARWLGLAVALLSMASPFLVSQDAATAIALAAMHLVAGAAWFLALGAPRTR